MINWTTKTLSIDLPVDLTGAEVYVTVQQQLSFANAPVTITDDAPTVTVADGRSLVVAEFTQAETGTLAKGVATVQCNWVFSDGTRDAMREVPIKVNHNHIAEVLTYGG